MNSIFEFLNKDLHNLSITSTLIDTSFSIDRKLEIKKTFYRVKSIKHWDPANLKYLKKNPKTLTSSISLPSPFVYKTPITELNEDTVGDTYRSQEEKVDLLNIVVIAMNSFIEEQMLILRQSRNIQICIITL